MSPWLTVLAAILSSGVVAAAVNALANRRNLGAQATRTDAETHRTDAETDELIQRTYGGMLEGMQRQLDRAVARVEIVETKNAGLQTTVDLMTKDRDDLLRWINSVLLPWVAAGAEPPSPDVPEHLADILPQWVRVKNPQPRRKPSQ